MGIGGGLARCPARVWRNAHGAIGYIGLRLYYVAFVDRADGRRIISLRKANQREVKRYAEA